MTGAGRKPGRPPSAVAELWQRYAADRGDALLQNQLIEQYLPWAKRVVNRATCELPPQVDRGALESAGQLALIRLVERFDPQRGFQFESYARPRLLGAIGDELRATDTVPRLARHRHRLRLLAGEVLTQRYGRPPTEDELDDELGAAAASSVVRETESLSRVIRGSGRPLTLGGALSGRESRDCRDWFAQITRGLDLETRIAIYLYYAKGQTMHRIGECLALSDSRVSQLIKNGLARMRRVGREKILESPPAP